VLFSNPEVAAFIRENFVAAWESVRPVPIVTVDFGNGRTLTRTVNGNVATYVCAPDGRVLDIIPGLNSAESYLQDLRHALNLYRASFAAFDRTVPEYHRANRSAPVRYEMKRNDFSKMAIERPVLVALGAKKPQAVAGATEEERLLAADTELNRKERKPLIHSILAERTFRPGEITQRVYRDVLHCDLDDPYLGLATRAFGGGAYEGR
jgi:hypothetical protein